MAITTAAQLIAALPGQVLTFNQQDSVSFGGGQFVSGWMLNSFPPPGANAGNTTTGAVPNNGDTGTIAFRAPSGSNALYLARLQTIQGANSSSGAGLWLADRLWHVGPASVTTSTTFSLTPTAVTRPSGATDCELWIEGVSTITGTPSGLIITVSYTNQAGTTGQTATLPTAFGSALAPGILMPFLLAPGDSGVKSVQSITVTAPSISAGTVNIVLLRRLAFHAPQTITQYTDPLDGVQLGLPKVYGTSALFCIYMAYTSTFFTGLFNLVEG